MNLEEVKKVLVEWEGDAYEVIKNYAIQMRRNDNEITEEFVEQYLGEELYTPHALFLFMLFIILFSRRLFRWFDS